MSGEDLFNPGEVDPNPVVDVDPNVDPFESLVGEGKKFKTPQDLAKGKLEADNFITQLQKETATLREELTKRLSVEEFVKKMNTTPAPSASTPPNQGSEERDLQNTANLTPEQVEKLVQETYSKQKQEDARAANVELVKRELQKKWGSDYARHLEAKTAQLGFGRDFATGLAATHPQAFLNLVLDRPTEANPDVSPPSPSTRGPMATSQEKKYSYYQKMMKENPKLYNSQAIQMEMYKQAQKLGADFYS